MPKKTDLVVLLQCESYESSNVVTMSMSFRRNMVFFSRNTALKTLIVLISVQLNKMAKIQATTAVRSHTGSSKKTRVGDPSYRGEACQHLDLDLVDLEVKGHFRIRKVQLEVWWRRK